MTLRELKNNIQQYQYLEDTNIIDVVLASILSARLSLGSPIFLVIIGASSGGKTQILKPLAMTDEKFIHSVDDLTPNTFLSGANIGKGKDPSLLSRIGQKGIIVISDLTLLFSKEKVVCNEILGSLRTIHDGYYKKYVGNKPEPLFWKGQITILAGGTPALYTNLEESSVMGERFLYYRMKDYDPMKAMNIAMSRTIYGQELNQALSNFYTNYLKEVMQYHAENEIKDLPDAIIERIKKIATLTERIRTTSHVDWQRNMDKLPVPALPMRLGQEMLSIAKGLSIMRQSEGQEIGPEDYKIIDWCGYSLANEEKRACLRVLAKLEYNKWIKTALVADLVGLDNTIIHILLQNLSAIGVLKRQGGGVEMNWKIANKEDWELIREIEGIKTEEPGEDEIDETVQQSFYNND